MSKVENQPQATASVPLEQFTKAHDQIAELRVENKNKDKELAQAGEKVANLEQQVENVKNIFAKAAKQLDELLPSFSSKISQGNPENFFSILAETLEEDKKAQDELQSKLQAALEKVAKIEEDARVAAREAKLDVVLAKSISSDEDRKAKKDKLAASVKSLDDESFEALLETLAELVPAEAKDYPAGTKDKKGKDKEEKDKKDKKKEVAAILGIDENMAAALIQAAGGDQSDDDNDDEATLAALANVTEEDGAPSAGEENDSEFNIAKSFSSLAKSMLNAHKPQGQE